VGADISATLLDDTVDGGTCTVTLKVGGTAVLEAVLNSTTNTDFQRAIANPGVHAIAVGDAITIDVETDGSFSTTGAGTPGLVINATITNEAFLPVTPGNGPLVDLTLESNVQDVDLTFDGEVADSIRFEFLVQTGGSNPALEFYPNGSAPSARTSKRQRIDSAGSGSIGSFPSNMYIAAADTSSHMRIVGTMNTKTGFYREYECRVMIREGASSGEYQIYQGVWDDLATALESLRVHSDEAASILTGSRFRIWKL